MNDESAQAPEVNRDLLRIFYGAGGRAVGVGELTSALGMDLEDVYREIDGLRAAGYVIGKSHPYGSSAYQLLEIPDRLYVHELERRRTTEWLASEITSRRSCGSTNELARDRAAEGAPHGAIVVAEEQTAGRGRRGRDWHSPPGHGLYLSVVLRPEKRIESEAALQIATGVAVAHTVMKITGRRATLRWPNDVLMERGKVAGILGETAGDAWIVGIGLNVSQRPEDFPEELRDEASSLAIETGHPLSRLPVLPSMLSTLEEWYDRLLAGEIDRIGDAFAPLCALTGRRVVLHRGEERLEGEVVEVNVRRGVRLRAGAEEEWIPAEHVTLVRPADDG